MSKGDNKEVLAKGSVCLEKTVSKVFVNVLAVISILGFIGIVSYSLSGRDIEVYIQSIWFFIMGIGFIFESSPANLFSTIRKEMGERNFSSLTTLVIGILSLIAAMFTLPFFGIENPAFAAVQGVISLVAIVFIIVETWVLR